MNTLYRIIRHVVVAGLYALLAVLSLTLGYLLRFDFSPTTEELRQMFSLMPWFVLVKLVTLLLTRQFQSLLTFFSVPDLRRILRSALLSGVAFWGLWLVFGDKLAPPRSVIVMDGILFVALLGGLRLFLRHTREQWESFSLVSNRHLESVAIVGAGQAGARLAQQFMTHFSFGVKPIVFLDDDPKKWGKQLHGVPVVGDPSWLLGTEAPPSLRRVIIAMPSAPRRRIQAIIESLEGKGFRLDTIQSFNTMMESKTSLMQLRPIQIDDLLGRDAAKLDSGAIEQMLVGQVVVVTGAGGSIGSELCRQILRYQPQRLLLIDQSEGLLFIIEQELIEAGFKNLIVPLVADICDTERIERIFSEYRPYVLFHAAAHKHVPMMESQPIEAIKNNAMGTAGLAHLALDSGVKRFVLISTDKAINPTNVMGATKRMAEMYLQALQGSQLDGTRFMAVRFGNVLGSSGSVVPIFQKQIAAGGPLKVTHPEVTRYFMTIPEAVGLVLQSAMMGCGGEIFLLDMGKPVKILDLARELILLQGLKPDEDIAIQFTGLRPGEKMYEELNYSSEELQATAHPKVYRLVTTAPLLQPISRSLSELESSFREATVEELKLQMTRLVPEYKPNFSGRKNQTKTNHPTVIAAGAEMPMAS
jgi:FlaA1/EpsC-like NDP-sugar epimerase